MVAAAPARAEPEEIEAYRRRLAASGFDLLLERWKELERVGSAVRLHGAPLCGEKRSPILGVIAATRPELPKAYREIGETRYDIGERVKVLWVLPDYPADRAGLRAGDTVLEIDGRRTRSAATLHARHGGGVGETIELAVERESRRIPLSVETVWGCFYPTVPVVVDTVNAYATGSRMLVTTGMLRFVRSPDELALMVGHELAHNLLGHPWSRPVFEAEADYLGAYLAARAGYDASVAPAFWARHGREYPYALDERTVRTHPISAERMLALETTTAEILARIDAGEPLLPRME